MNISCPNCNHAIEQNSPPMRGPATDGSEGWICLKCPAVVCGYPIRRGPEESTPCYMDHTMKHHPHLYEAVKKATAGAKKGKKHRK